MNRSFPLAVAVSLLIAGAAAAQQPHTPPHGPPAQAGHADHDFGRHFFPPELIMQQQRNIGLTAEQRATISKVVQELQARALDLQWKMQDEAQKVGDMVKAASIDEAAALAQVDRVLAIERDVKRAHLAMLIRLKNALTAEQQAKLESARGAMEQQSPR